MGSLVNYIYIVSGALFILSLKWMNSPATRAARRLRRRSRHAAGDRRHADRASLTTGNGFWRRSSSAPRSACPSPTSCR